MIQVEIGFILQAGTGQILNFPQNPRQSQSVGGGWRVGGFMRVMPRCGSILQAETCQILRLAENPRWSRVWQLRGYV